MPKAFIVVEREHHPDMVIEYPDYATASANLDSLFLDGICAEDATDAYATALPKRTVLEAVGEHEYVKDPPLGYPEPAYGAPTPEHYTERERINAHVAETRKRLGI